MNEERFLEIMDKDIRMSRDGCNASRGLDIIRKFCPKSGVEGADHDVIYSVSVEKIIEGGIDEASVEALRALNWMVEDEAYLACFV